MSLDHVLSRGVWPHCFGWSCEIRWKDLKHPELHPKATDELMPCDFQNDCSGLWCLWHILWINALRNTNNVLNGNTKVGINKRRTFFLLFRQEFTEMGSCNERSFSVICMKEMFDPSSDFRSMVSCFQVNDVDIKLQFPDPMKVRFESAKSRTILMECLFRIKYSVCQPTQKAKNNWLNF